MKVSLRYDLTLNTGNYNNFKPSLEFVVDTDLDIEEQILAGRSAMKALRSAVSEEMESILETEGMQGWESLLVKHDNALKNIETRLGKVEKRKS